MLKSLAAPRLSIFRRLTTTTVKDKVAQTAAPVESSTLIIRGNSPAPTLTPSPAASASSALTPGYWTSDVPDTLMNKRTVRIYKPARTAMQSGWSGEPHTKWQLDFDPVDKWENRLMGWTSRFVFEKMLLRIVQRKSSFGH